MNQLGLPQALGKSGQSFQECVCSQLQVRQGELQATGLCLH